MSHAKKHKILCTVGRNISIIGMYLIAMFDNHHCRHWCARIIFVESESNQSQARSQLGTPGGSKSFPRGAQIFWIMSNIFKLCPTPFSRERKFF